MKTSTIVLLVILIITIGIVVAMYFLGKKAQKRQAEQQDQIEAAKQTVAEVSASKTQTQSFAASLEINDDDMPF